MKKLLLFSSLALASAATMAQSLNPDQPEVTEEALTFSFSASWGGSWTTGPGTALRFTKSQGQIHIKQFSEGKTPKTIKITLSDVSMAEYGMRATLLNPTVSNDPDAQSVQLSYANVEYTIDVSSANQAKSGLRLDIQRAYEGTDGETVDATVGKVVVEYTDGSSEEITNFKGSGWGFSTLPSASGTVVMDGTNWAGILITDADGNDLQWDPEADYDTEFTITVNFSSLQGEMLFQFDDNTTAATDYVNSEDARIQPGETTATFKINRNSVSHEGKTGIALNRLYLKNWAGGGTKSPTSYSVSISGGSISKTTYVDPTALKPVPQATVLSTDYISVVGVRSATPQRGLNIVRQKLSDGSVRVSKTLVR